ncbi:MAG: integration host factor subunit beta [Phocaeicola dorei]|nr:integration host factor subunit beta [Phocaeicola dorei]
MTKAEIVNEISLKTGTDRKEVPQIVEGFMESVKTSLANGENVYLRGFGSFILKHRAEKVARNINRNTTIIIPAHDIPAFKPSKDFTLN